MNQDTFLKNSEFIRQTLAAEGSDATTFPVEIAFPLVRYSVGEWLTSGAIMSSSFFTQTQAAVEDEPLIEPLENERDDEAVTPSIEELQAIDDEASGEGSAEDIESEDEEEMPGALVEEPLSCAVEVDPKAWEPLTQSIDQYFAFMNRLVMFSPEVHKATWQAFLDEVESIFNKATLTAIGMSKRFEMVERLYRDVAKV